MSSENTNEKKRSRTGGRPWDDLCPDILNSIYAKLPSPVDGAEFGSVCKYWRQIYSATADYAAPRSTHNAYFTLCAFRRGPTITLHPQKLPDGLRKDFAGASVVGRDGSGWWLLCNSAGKIFCCFNPLFQSSGRKSIIEVPRLGNKNQTNPRHTRAAFSAPPTDPSTMILVVRGGGGGGGGNPTTLTMLLSRNRRFTIRRLEIDDLEICAGIGYREGKFFCLFESGDVVIIGIEKDYTSCEVSLMLAAAPPLAPEQFHRINYLSAVSAAERGFNFEVVSWERVGRELRKDPTVASGC